MLTNLKTEIGRALIAVALTALLAGRVARPAQAITFGEVDTENRFSNVGAIDHSYVIVGLGKGVELRPGETRSIHLPFDTDAGSYQAICDIPDHVEQGMVGTLEVG